MTKMGAGRCQIILEIPINAQNDATSKPFSPISNKITFAFIKLLKIRKKFIFREILLFSFYFSTKNIHVENNQPCPEYTLHNQNHWLKQIVLDISFNNYYRFYYPIAHFLWPGGDSIY